MRARRWQAVRSYAGPALVAVVSYVADKQGYGRYIEDNHWLLPTVTLVAVVYVLFRLLSEVHLPGAVVLRSRRGFRE